MTESRLRELLDRAEISDLMLAFGAALDGKDWEAYGATFTEDATFTILGQARCGRAEIVAGPARDLVHYDTLQHFSANHRIVLEGDTARASHYLIAVHVPSAEEPALHADTGGRYDSVCVRTAEGWRFAEVELSILWTSGQKFELAPHEE